MSELIKVSTNENQEQTVSGRVLHEFLEVNTQYTKWFDRMCEYGFGENQDFIAISQKRLTAQGNETTFTDHVLKLDMAKELCMLARSDRGKQARQYFIQLEKEWNTPDKVMARALILAQNTILQLKPKAEVYDVFIDKSHVLGFRELAKELKVKEIVLRLFLENSSIAYRQTKADGTKGKWKPYAKYVELGWLEIKDITSGGFTGTQMVFTMKGRDCIRKMMTEKGYNVA